jgi:hypothetical protein
MDEPASDAGDGSTFMPGESSLAAPTPDSIGRGLEDNTSSVETLEPDRGANDLPATDELGDPIDDLPTDLEAPEFIDEPPVHMAPPTEPLDTAPSVPPTATPNGSPTPGAGDTGL